MYLYTCICMYIHVYVCVYMDVCAHVYICTYVHMHVFVYSGMFPFYGNEDLFSIPQEKYEEYLFPPEIACKLDINGIYTYIYVCFHVYVSVYVCMCVSMFTYICKFSCAHVRTCFHLKLHVS